MASQTASDIARIFLSADWRRLTVADTERVKMIDEQLAEVREVLDGLTTFVFDEGEGPRPHWCDPEDNTSPDCTLACRRARQLAERLKVK